VPEIVLEQFKDLRVTDVVDILFVSILAYTLVTLVGRTRARFVAFGVLILTMLYVVASFMELRLTMWILRGFFAVLVLVLVVVFQEELRQWFEGLALWGLRRRGERSPVVDATDTLVKCCVDFAAARIGALVVLPGEQAIHRHVEGGIELGGRLSEPLLKSIFDPHSPGHDGAVILDGDRVTRFAVHLPLSTSFAQLGGVGTRHSAALGLAELSDALCVVVSEERGEVSVALNGELKRMTGARELGAQLRAFQARTRPAADQRRAWLPAVTENWVAKVATLIAVIGLWSAFVPGAQPATFVFDVPVRATNVPPELDLVDVKPREVTLSLSGARRAFYLFDANSLSVNVDATLAKLGRRTFEITGQSIEHPKELQLDSVEPRKVKLFLEPRPTAAASAKTPAESATDALVTPSAARP